MRKVAYSTNVTIRGTWSRTRTTRREVTSYRADARAAALARGCLFDARCFREPLDEKGTLGGTFSFTVPVQSYTQNQKKQAVFLLQALLASVTCRSPKFKVTKASTLPIRYGGEGWVSF